MTKLRGIYEPDDIAQISENVQIEYLFAAKHYCDKLKGNFTSTDTGNLEFTVELNHGFLIPR